MTEPKKEIGPQQGAGPAVAITTFGRGGVSGAEASKNIRLVELTLSQASGMIHNGTVTSTELTRALLDRINTLNPKINCYITVMGVEALAQAATLDGEQKAGRLRGPLHGIPIALKDNIDTQGVRTTAASPMFKNRTPREDAEVVERLKAAGAVIIGKLNLHEFATGCAGAVSYFGPTRNPWSLDHVTGGSSSGSGAAVAARMAYGALGTDTAGSIRLPSAWCGIVGLKPTVGLVSIRGIIPCVASLDHCGPMGRTVEDVAVMLGAMAGYDPLDIFSVPSSPENYLAALEQPVKGFRLSAPQSFFDNINPEIEPAITAALDQIVKLTAGITSRAPLWDGDPGGSVGDYTFYHHDLIEKYGLEYMPPLKAQLSRIADPRPGTRVATAGDEARARQRLMTTRRMIGGIFKEFDIVVVPTTRSAPQRINDSLKSEMERSDPDWRPKKVYDFFSISSQFCVNTEPFNAFGIPALSVPCGFTKSGLPVGIMIAGPHFAEGKILALAYAYQQSTNWHTMAPSVTGRTNVPPIVETSDTEAAKRK